MPRRHHRLTCRTALPQQPHAPQRRCHFWSRILVNKPEVTCQRMSSFHLLAEVHRSQATPIVAWFFKPCWWLGFSIREDAEKQGGLIKILSPVRPDRTMQYPEPSPRPVDVSSVRQPGVQSSLLHPQASMTGPPWGRLAPGARSCGVAMVALILNISAVIPKRTGEPRTTSATISVGLHRNRLGRPLALQVFI